MIIFLTHKRWRKIKKAMKSLKKIESTLVELHTLLVNEDEDDDPRPHRESDESIIDFQIRLASWEHRQRSKNER